VNIEKVAQLAKLYATGSLPDKELRAIKERANVAGNEVADKDNGAHLVPNEWGTASGLTRDPETGCGAFNQRIEMAREKADFSTGLRAMESSIRVFSRPSGFRCDQFVSDKARTSSSLALFFIAALIAVGATFVWHSQGDEAKEMVRRRWALSLDWLLSMSTHTRDMLHNRLGC
jgi:putative SOS response-associated peptidase YedK